MSKKTPNPRYKRKSYQKDLATRDTVKINPRRQKNYIDKQVELTIEKMVASGKGMARDDEGIVFVSAVLSGEKIKSKRLEKKKGTRFCHEFEIISASAERVAADCDAYPECGGCDLLYLSAKGQHQLKNEMIKDVLSRSAKLQDLSVIENVLTTTKMTESRRRCRLTVARNGKIGFLQAGKNNTVVEHENCKALSTILQQSIQKLKEMDNLVPMRIRLAHDDRGHVSACVEEIQSGQIDILEALVEAGVANGALCLDDQREIYAVYGDYTLEGEIAPKHPKGPFLSDAAAFSQASRFASEEISRQVLRHLHEAEFSGGPVVELFAGSGHLSFSLAEHCEEVLAIEGDPYAVEYFRKNIEISKNIDNIRLIWGNIDGQSFDEMYATHIEILPEALIVDPPRNGIQNWQKIIELLEPDIIIMVSCDLATGARDIKTALDLGYALLKLTPIDAFVRTSHVEWVATLALPQIEE